MSLTSIKSKFHIALDGVGLILQGAPDRVAYDMKQAPIYGNRFAQGDRSYGDFSFWWFWAQTSWGAGYKNEKKWSDDGKFLESEGVSVIEKIGSVVLNWKLARSVTLAKTVTWRHFGNAGNTFVAVGSNDTDQKMKAMNIADGTNVWEDSATGAEEKIFCTGEFGDGDLYIGCKTVGSGSSMFKKGTGGAFADVGTHSAGAGIYQIVTNPAGDGMYLFTFNAGIYFYDRSAGTFTQKKTTYPYGSTAGLWSISGENGQGCWRVGDKIYFTYRELNLAQSQLWAYNITDDAYEHIYSFGAGINPNKLIEFNGNIYLFDRNNNIGRLQVWKYTVSSSTMSRIHEIGRDAETSNIKGNPVKDAESIYFIVDDGTSDFQLWQLDSSDNIFQAITPPAAYATAANMLGMSGNGTLAIFLNGASGTNAIDSYGAKPNDSRQSTGFITSSIFDADIPALDKLFYDVTITFDALASGQAIEVHYSTDGGVSFTSLGTASFTTEGAIENKSFLFGASIVSKKMVLKFTLIGGGSDTPSLNDFSCRYIPFINYTKLWNLNINCGDEVKRLDGNLVETTGRELKGRLERAWWTKSILDYQDIDYATTLVDDAGFDNSQTTITVDSTEDFPEQGRLHVDSEEITYTGKTPTTFTGCTRGARETKAASHVDDSVINNAYKVILTDLQYSIPIALEDKELEYVVALSLREV